MLSPSAGGSDEAAPKGAEPTESDAKTGYQEKKRSAIPIGGPFTLTDQNGNEVTEKALEGHYSLVSFGFTQCPDVCPTTLNLLTDAATHFDEKNLPITPVFISVDPVRDTPATLKDYASHFHPRLLALTGTPEQVKSVASAYKVYYFSHQKIEADKNYAVDHSGFIYLMDPAGLYVTHFPYTIPEGELITDLQKIIGTAKKDS